MNERQSDNWLQVGYKPRSLHYVCDALAEWATAVLFSLSLPWVLMWHTKRHSEQVLKFVVKGNIFLTLRGVSSSCNLSCYSRSHFFSNLKYAFRCSKACFSAPKWPRPIASLLEAWPEQTVGILLLQYTLIQFSRVRWQRNMKTVQRSDRYGLL